MEVQGVQCAVLPLICVMKSGESFGFQVGGKLAIMLILLSADLLDTAVAFGGTNDRLRRLLAKIQSGQPFSMGVVGGSGKSLTYFTSLLSADLDSISGHGFLMG